MGKRVVARVILWLSVIPSSRTRPTTPKLYLTHFWDMQNAMKLCQPRPECTDDGAGSHGRTPDEFHPSGGVPIGYFAALRQESKFQGTKYYVMYAYVIIKPQATISSPDPAEAKPSPVRTQTIRSPRSNFSHPTSSPSRPSHQDAG